MAQAWGDSALLVPIPEAEPIVAELRLEHDAIAARGVPAHVTVLFPFVPRALIRPSVHARLRDLFASVPRFEYRFIHVGRFAGTTVFLAPEPASAFTFLTDAVAARWPEHPPYGGAFADVIPHLTVGDRLADGVADRLAGEVRESLDTRGPVAGQASEVWLMTEGMGESWSVTERYPLAVRGSSS